MVVITNERALQPDYVPRDLYHREGQVEVLTTCLSPLRGGVAAENALITGPTGSGKTTLAKYVVDRASRELEAVRWAYVDCLAASSMTAVLRQVAIDAGFDVPVNPAGVSTQIYVEALRQSNRPVVVVLDEVGSLPDPKLLGTLYELETTSWFAITIDETEFLADADPGIQSRVRSAAGVHLDRFSMGQLVDILEGRIGVGLNAHKIEPEAIEAVADAAAGNARLAIATLRQAAMFVQRTDMDVLTPSVVQEVGGEARSAIQDSLVRSLGTHKRLLYELVREAGPIRADELHERYEAEISSPRSKRARRNYLSHLVSYELVEKQGSGRGTVYSTVGVE